MEFLYYDTYKDTFFKSIIQQNLNYITISCSQRTKPFFKRCIRIDICLTRPDLSGDRIFFPNWKGKTKRADENSNTYLGDRSKLLDRKCLFVFISISTADAIIIYSVQRRVFLGYAAPSRSKGKPFYISTDVEATVCRFDEVYRLHSNFI